MMKKQLRILALSSIFLGLMAGCAMAVEGDVLVFEPLPGTETSATPQTNQEEVEVYEVLSTNVPQAVIDYRDKRLHAREQRSRMLKMREETINALDAEDEAGLEPINNITDQL